MLGKISPLQAEPIPAPVPAAVISTTTLPAVKVVDDAPAAAVFVTPTFFALDVRIDRRFVFRRSQLVTYLDVQNATARKNISQIAWDARLRAPKPNESIGILPSIGINWEF